MSSSSPKTAFRLAALMLLAALGVMQASSVVVANTDGGLYSYLTKPLIFFRSYITSPTVQKILVKPDGSKLYIVSNSPTRTILILKPDFTAEVNPPINVASLSDVWLTPDGSRLLVLAGNLRIFDTLTDKEITPAGGFDLSTINDIAISPDSRTVYTFSGATQKIYLVDLILNKVVTSVASQSPSGYIQVAPNGLLYYATDNLIYELDPYTLANRARISFSGQPSKLVFNADSTRAFAVNSQLLGSSPVLSYDLVNRVLANGAGTVGTSFRNLLPINSTQLLGISNESGRLVLIPMAGGASSEVRFAGATGTYDNFLSIFTTEECPSPRILYLLQANRMIRVDLATLTVLEEMSFNTGTAQIAAYAKDPATGSPATSIAYGDGQIINPGLASAPVGVRIMNASGQPLGGVTVSFTPNSPGLTLNANSAVTNPDGYAYTSFTAPQAVGTYTITANAGSTTNTFVINVAAPTGSGGGGPVAGAPRIYSGNGQLTFQSTSGVAPLVVQVRDAAGAPMSGVTVNWAVTSGSAVLSSLPVTTTDGSGYAQVTFIGSVYIQPLVPYDRSIVTATTTAGSVSFSLITLANTSSGQGASINARLLAPTDSARFVTGKVGQTLPGAIQVFVQTTFFGQVPLPGVGITASTGSVASAGPTAQCSGGTVLTDSNGLAVCDVVIGGTPGTAQITVVVGGNSSFVPMPLTALPGDVAQIVPTGGDNSAGTPGQTVTLKALLKDAGGNVLPGMTAQWEVVSQGTATLSKVSDVADSQGQITTVVTLGTASGPIQIRARAGNVVYTFTITINFQIGAFTKVSGDNQSASQNGAFPKPLVVKVTDSNNQPVSGSTINFAVTSGVAFLSASTAVTDSTGTASVTATASTAIGPVTVQATTGGQSLTFSLTVLPPGANITGFYDIAGFQPGMTPGALIRMVGKNLVPNVTGSVLGGSLFGGFAYTVSGVSVSVGGYQAPIYAVSRINGEESVDFQVPFEVPAGVTTVIIKVDDSVTTLNNVAVSQYLPGIFMQSRPNGVPYGVVLKSDGTALSPTNPARRGDILTVAVSGIGPVSPAVATNAVGTGNQNVQAQVIVGVNHAGMRVISAQYAQNLIGVYLITFELASDTPTGTDRPLQIAVRVGDGTVNSNETVIPLIQ